MDLDNVWVQFGVHVLVGMIAGGITNTVAVWMIFHPYERRFFFQGAIPKNKARLANSIGRTVGERLLTPEDVLRELAGTGVRETLDLRLAELLTDALQTERGSLRELLPDHVLTEVERAVAGFAPAVAARITDYVAGPEFEARALEFVARARSELALQPIGAVLTPERRAELRVRAGAWGEELAASPELERGIREYLDRHAGEILSSSTPLLEKVPPPVVRALEGAIDAYLPMAVEKLGEFLHHPAARERIRESLHELFARFVRDLRFHERLIARVMVTERTLDRVLDSIERDGVEQLATLLGDPVVRDEITLTIHDAVMAYMRKPLSEIIGPADSERAQSLVRVTGDYVLRVLRDHRTRQFIVAKLDEVLERAEGRTWGDLIKGVDDSTLAGWIVEATRSQKSRDLAQEAVRAGITGLLDRPIGKPGRLFPPDFPARLGAALAPPLWEWIQSQLPRIIERMNVQDMVEQKILGFSVQRVEEIIRGVIDRELQLIVRLGYVLGALIGLATFGVARALG